MKQKYYVGQFVKFKGDNNSDVLEKITKVFLTSDNKFVYDLSVNYNGTFSMRYNEPEKFIEFGYGTAIINAIKQCKNIKYIITNFQ